MKINKILILKNISWTASYLLLTILSILVQYAYFSFSLLTLILFLTIFDYKKIPSYCFYTLLCFFIHFNQKKNFEEKHGALEKIKKFSAFCVATESTKKDSGFQTLFLCNKIFTSEKKLNSFYTISAKTNFAIPLGKTLYIKCFLFPTKTSMLSTMQKKSIHAYAGLTYCSSLSHYSLDSFIYKIVSPIKIYFEKIKNSISKKIELAFDKNNNELFNTLFLGNSSVNQEISAMHRKKFSVWGISHYLARSGLHVSLLLSCIMFLCGLCCIRFEKSLIGAIIFIIFYTFFSYSSISFARAITMFFIISASRIFHFNTTSLHALCITSLLFLVYNHYYFFCVDFQLSFLTTFIVLLILSYKKEIIT